MAWVLSCVVLFLDDPPEVYALVDRSVMLVTVDVCVQVRVLVESVVESGVDHVQVQVLVEGTVPEGCVIHGALCRSDACPWW